MAHAEKNDVDISKLFHYGDKFIVADRKGKKATVYIRLVGDAELNRARVFALRKSAELRRKLRDTTSDEYIAFIPSKDMVGQDVLLNLILTLSIQEFTREAMVELPALPLPAEPKANSGLEAQEKYQIEVDAYPEKRSKQLQEYVEKRVAEETEALNKLTEEQLVNQYNKLIVNELCEQEMIRRYQEMCTFFGTYSDKDFTNRLFADFDKFDNLPQDVKQQLVGFYNSLEISADELKK